jgi:hypothetical protein
MSVADHVGRAVAVRRAAALVAVGVLAAGCGGSDESGVEGWANDVCEASTDWREALRAAGEDLRAGPTTREDLEAAGEEVTDATEEFAEELRDLGRPETEAGDEVQEILDRLAASVEQNKANLESEIAGASGLQGAVDAATAVASTVAVMGAQLQSTFEQLQQIDPGGELSAAFESSDACESLSAG